MRPGVWRRERSTEDAEGGGFEAGQDRRSNRVDAARVAFFGKGAGEVDDRDHFAIEVDEPALADAVLAVPRQLLDAVVPFGAGGQNFGDEIRRAPHLVANE